MTDAVANLTLRLLQEIRAEMATKADLGATNADLTAIRADLAAFRAETGKKFDILAETVLKQSRQIEIPGMAFNRHDDRLERIEMRIDRVDQRLGLDQTTS